MDLINTLEKPGEFDALTNLRKGEPYFLLVGRDRSAPDLVLEWAKRNRDRALRKFEAGLIPRPERDRELRKSTQAEEIAWAMQSYKAGHRQVEAALAAEDKPKPTYRGQDLPEETKRSDKLQSQRVRAAAALSNADAEVAALRELLDGGRLPLSEGRDWDLDVFGETLRDAADTITPPRPIG